MLNRHLKAHLPIEDMSHIMDQAMSQLFIEFSPALEGCFSKYTFTPTEHMSNEKICMGYLQNDIPRLLKWYYDGKIFVKWSYSMDATFTRLNPDGETVFKNAGFSSIDYAFYNVQTDRLVEQFDSMRNDIINRIDKYSKESGWILYKILSFKLYLYRFQLNYGGEKTKLRTDLEAKQCVINIDSSNCFKWAVLAALHQHEANRNKHRIQVI